MNEDLFVLAWKKGIKKVGAECSPVTKSAKAIQFEIINYTVEIKGLCVNCKYC